VRNVKQEKILIFAGTTEGRRLYKLLTDNGITAAVSVATPYGRDALVDAGLVFVGRLHAEQMETLIRQHSFTLIVDATHPYATEVTANIRLACQRTGVPFIRLLREGIDCQDVITFADVPAAVDYLRQCPGNILSTIGSKELHHFTQLENYPTRVFARILPLPEAISHCYELGFKGSNLICMQGPFSYELNLALLKQYNCRFLVTKDSGVTGGFAEKLQAARAAGAKVILIARPYDVGLSMAEVIKIIEDRCRVKLDCHSPGADNNSEQQLSDKHKYFPLFVNIQGKEVLVVGGGTIATRRVKSLVHFACRVKVVAPTITDELRSLVADGAIEYESRTYTTVDLVAADLVVAATDRREINQQIGREAKERGLLVSVADCREECNFYFPAIIANNDVVIGVSSGGKSPTATAKWAARVRGVIQDEN